jgi:hypothetical protein
MIWLLSSRTLVLMMLAAPGVLALILVLMRGREKKAGAPQPDATPDKPRTIVDPDVAELRLNLPALSQRLKKVEVELNALQSAMAGMQQDVNDLVQRGTRSASSLDGSGSGAYPGQSRPDTGFGGGYAADSFGGGDDTHVLDLVGPGSSGRPVEIDGGMVVPSRSLHAVGMLVEGG